MPRCAVSGNAHFVPVDDLSPEHGGDQIALHEDRPADFGPTTPVVLLIHGLSGSYESTYMCRMAEQLTARGYTTFRMDMRGCGAGEDVARRRRIAAATATWRRR